MKKFWRENWLLILIFALALSLRLYVLFTEGDRLYLGTDDKNYVKSAETLIRTGMLTYGGWPGPTVFVMPAYPFLLSSIFILAGSTNWLAVRLVQVVISLAALWFSVKLGERLGGRWVGLLTGLILAVYPPNLTAPAFLMTEVVFTFCLLLSVYCFDRAAESGELKWFIYTGAALGLETYFRPTAGLLPVVFFVYLLLCSGYSLKRAVYVTIVTGLVPVLLLSPWIIRNYRVFHEFIPFTVSGGNPLLRGTYIDDKIIIPPNDPSKRFPQVKDNHVLTDRAQMKFAKKRLVEGFKTDFWGYLRWYTIGKFTDFWGGPYYYRELSYLPAPKVQAFHNLLLVAGVGGLLVSLLRRKYLAFLMLMVSAYFTFIHMVYLTGPRYGFPTVQLLAVLAAYALIEGGKVILAVGHTNRKLR